MLDVIKALNLNGTQWPLTATLELATSFEM
jgi:hypothetical protein